MKATPSELQAIVKLLTSDGMRFVYKVMWQSLAVKWNCTIVYTGTYAECIEELPNYTRKEKV